MASEPQPLESGLPDQVGEDEMVARFVYDSGKLNTSGPKKSALLPERNPDDGRFELSVGRHGPEPEASLRELGVAYRSDRTCRGAAVFSVLAAIGMQLSAIAAEPPHRHACLVGWHDGDPDESRSRHLQTAQELIASCTWIRFE